jgi:hypothetical protein
VVVQTGGQITIGATVTAGTVYYLSGTAGGIRPAADNTTGDYPQVIGMASRPPRSCSSTSPSTSPTAL